MSQSSSADVGSESPAAYRWPVLLRQLGRPSFPYDITVRASLWVSVAVVTVALLTYASVEPPASISLYEPAMPALFWLVEPAAGWPAASRCIPVTISTTPN